MIFVVLLIVVVISLVILSLILSAKGGLFPFGKMSDEEIKQCYSEKNNFNKESKNKKK